MSDEAPDTSDADTHRTSHPAERPDHHGDRGDRVRAAGQPGRRHARRPGRHAIPPTRGPHRPGSLTVDPTGRMVEGLSLIHISEPTRLRRISYAVFCLK